MTDDENDYSERDLYRTLRDLSPLEGVEIHLTEPATGGNEVESFVGAVGSVYISVLRYKDSIRIEGKTDALRDPYDWFQITAWYNIEDEMFEFRNVDGLFYRSDGEKIRRPLGDLERVTRRQWWEREWLFDDPDEGDDDG